MASLFCTHRHLIPLQVVMFFFYTGTMCLVPFLSSHMRAIGLSRIQTTIINTVAAWTSVCGPAILGTLAERYSKYRLTLLITLLMSGVAFTTLLFIPRVVRITRNPILEFDCSSSVKVEKCSNWQSCSDSHIATDNRTLFQLYNCKYQCSGAGISNMPYPLHVCFEGDEGSLCLVYDPYNYENDSVEFESRLASWFYEEEHNVESFNFLAHDPEITPEFINLCIYKPMDPIIVNNKKHKEIICRPMPEGCTIKCLINLFYSEKLIKPQRCMEVIGDPNFTFLTYLVIRIFADIFLFASLSLLDALTIKNINDFYGVYAKTRIWPALGMAMFTPVSGILVDYYSYKAGKPDYSPAIFIFDGFILIACILTMSIALQPKPKFRNYFPPPIRARKATFWSFEMTVLIILVIILGTAWGFLDTFLYWFYNDIGATKKLLGFAITLTLFCSFPFLLISKNLIRNIGRGHLVVFAFFFYGLRYGGISYINNPWWILPFESMATFTIIITWIALVAYIQSLAPKSWRLRAQYLLNILHFGIGRGVGCLSGGLLSEEFGVRQTFRGFAVVLAVFGFLFLLFYHLVIKRTRAPRHPFLPHYPSGVVLNDAWPPPAVDSRPNGDASNHLAALAPPNDDEEN